MYFWRRRTCPSSRLTPTLCNQVYDTTFVFHTSTMNPANRDESTAQMHSVDGETSKSASTIVRKKEAPPFRKGGDSLGW